MAYQSTFTGAQVDAAVGRVNDNEFVGVEASFLDVDFSSGMVVASGESKYLTRNFVLDPNSYYRIDLRAFVNPVVGTTNPPNAFYTTGADIGDGIGQLIGSGISEAPKLSRASFTAPGGLSLTNAYVSGDPLDERAISYTGYFVTGAAPQCRFYYYADVAANALRVEQFDVTFTKIRAADGQAVDVSAPTVIPA